MLYEDLIGLIRTKLCGKGYAGTVLRLHDERRPHFPKLSVLVQWDNGDKGLYRAGYEQAFDLRIIDTANSGSLLI